MEGELQKRLVDKAGRLLAKRPYSRGEMRAKLSRFAEPSSVEHVLDHLQALDLLNDLDYAYNFASSRIRLDGWGPVKVRDSLLRRQIGSEIIDAALDRITAETDESVALGEYVDRHCHKTGLPGDRAGVQRLINHLRRRGFSNAIIYRTLRRIIAAEIWDYFDMGE